MTNELRSGSDYELFIYTLPDRFPSIKSSTLQFVRRGATLARVVGEIEFENSFRLVVRQRIVYERLPALITGYGYEVWQGEEKLCWYDSQPHPDDASLQSTHPHHKHSPPDPKHNRLPAPELSFNRPNIPLLVREIEQLVKVSGA